MNRGFLASVIAVVVAFSIIPVIPLVIAFLAGIIVKRRINGDEYVSRNRSTHGKLHGQVNEVKEIEASQASHERDWTERQRGRTKHLY